MPVVQRIVPCLWFNSEAEEAAQLYTGIFPNSRITEVTRYGEAGREHHGKPPGSVLMVAFELDGQGFTTLNGLPEFRFTEAISFQVLCDTQQEVDYYWDKLGEGGDEKARQCGWLKDRFGVSWQVVPKILLEMLVGDTAKSQRALQALFPMKKLDIATLKRAYDGA
jgi:predicted 3-demethylubiquinone-9 3-methyltransferase (glyoxalase superfamily)